MAAFAWPQNRWTRPADNGNLCHAKFESNCHLQKSQALYKFLRNLGLQNINQMCFASKSNLKRVSSERFRFDTLFGQFSKAPRMRCAWLDVYM
jgi:hypothetical protein